MRHPEKAFCSDTHLDTELLQLRELARDFSRKEIDPLAEKIDREHEYPAKIIEKLGEMGFMGIMCSPKYGGAGLSTLAYVTVLEEISVACASTSVIMSVNNSLVIHPLEKFGSEAMKELWLKKLATGEALGCYCLSEPGNGSDAAALKTRAHALPGGGWRLSGVKNFITNGREADVAIVYATLDPSLGHKGIAAFVVDSKSAGFSVGKVEAKLGIRGSSTTQIHLNNVEVPADALIGDLDQGFKVAMNTLDGGRIGIATQAVGIARACVEEAAVYSLARTAFGKPIAQLGAIQVHLAQMQTQTEAARLLTRAAAIKKDSGERFSMEAAMAKLYASEAAMDNGVRGIQVLGGYGYTQDYPMERHFRDAKITEIYEGTSEIQQIVIASQLVKDAGT